MLQQIKSLGGGYSAGASATALAGHGASGAYATPSGKLVGGAKYSLGCACSQAQENGLARLRKGPAVPSDYQIHEPGRLLGEAEALGALGCGDGSGGMRCGPAPAVPQRPAQGSSITPLLALGALALFVWRS